MAGELFDMYALGDGADAQMKQKALADALRARIQGQQQQADFGRAWGNMGMLSGDKVLGAFGQAQGVDSRHLDQVALAGDKSLADAGEGMAKFRLTKALEAARKLESQKKSALDSEEGLRKELMGNPVTKATQEVATAYGRIQDASKDPSPAGDIALVYGFMKMMDPGSTVREGEFATAANAGGIPQQVVSMYNKAINGQRLAPEIRSDFLKKSKGLYGVQLGRYKALENSYKGLAEGAGVAPDRVAIPLGFEEQAAPQEAATGKTPVRDRAGKVVGFINPDGTEEEVR